MDVADKDPEEILALCYELEDLTQYLDDEAVFIAKDLTRRYRTIYSKFYNINLLSRSESKSIADHPPSILSNSNSTPDKIKAETDLSNITE
jgi:16S rRNA C1402 (ribose-2'-O) methylase RsmI